MLSTTLFDLSTFQVIGLLGACLYIASYVALTLHWIDSASPAYFAAKLLAAALVLISLAEDFNIAALVIQVFFLAMSAVGIALRLSRRKAAPRADLSRGLSTPRAAANDPRPLAPAPLPAHAAGAAPVPPVPGGAALAPAWTPPA